MNLWPFGKKNQDPAAAIEEAGAGDTMPSYFPMDNWTDTNVSPDDALALSTVYACVRLLATAMMLPCKTVEDDADGRSVPAVVPGTSALLGRRPNPDVTAPHFWALVTANLLLWGNHYSAKVFRNGRLVALYPMLPSTVDVYRQGGRKMFRVNGRDGFTTDHVLHIPYLSFETGLVGHSPVSVQRQRIAVALAQSVYQQRLYRQGTLASGVLKTPGTVGEDAHRRLASQWSAKYSGGRNAHKPIILEQGMEFQQMSMNPVDAQFMQQVQWSEVETARVFGVPASMVDAATQYSLRYENPALNDHTFVKWGVRPLAQMIEAAVSGDPHLFNQDGPAHARFNLDAHLRADIKTRADVAKIWHEIGVKNPNENRVNEDLPRREGGDEYTTAVKPSSPGGEA
jgi:HK97 family phage portal protein